MEPGSEEEETKIPEPSSSSAEQDACTTMTTASGSLSRYESQKRKDWNTFQQYLRNHKPPLILGRCSEANVFSSPCACPLRQAWGSLDALIGRFRTAFDENHRPGHPDSNPFTARACIYLREVRESQAKACGIPYQKKKKKRKPPPPPTTTTVPSVSKRPELGLRLLLLLPILFLLLAQFSITLQIGIYWFYICFRQKQHNQIWMNKWGVGWFTG